jgi:sugar phosphate isomerase/epimerase
MPYIHHIQAKFYEMTDEGVEYSIPYDKIIPVLIEGGYSGYLSSEYEGNRHIQDAFPVDSLEQVRRQHSMFQRLLGTGTETDTDTAKA